MHVTGMNHTLHPMAKANDVQLLDYMLKMKVMKRKSDL